MTINCILVVDDNEGDQFLAEHLIKKYLPDTQQLKAYDGEEALRVIAESDVKPDIILLDINMPGMDGFEFLEAYNQLADRSAVVAMVSSSEDGRDRDRCEQYEFVVDYFVKPLDVEAVNKLERLVSPAA